LHWTSLATTFHALRQRVEKYFEDPEDESAIKGFEGAKKWATENNIKEVLEQISIYEKALKDVEDDDEAAFHFALQT
jgi:hypothetical protein